MIRYTVEMEGNDEGFKIEPIKEILEKQLTRKLAVSKVKTAAQIQLNGIILLTTDLSSSKLLELFCLVKKQFSSIRYISARLGWDIPPSFEDIIHLTEEEKDPQFYLFKTPLGGEAIYTYNQLGWIYLISSCAFLFAGVMFIYGKNDSLLVFPTLMFIVFVIYPIFNMIPSIKCDERSIEFRYLLRPKLTVAWSEIRSLRIIQGRGWFSIIQRIDGKTVLPLRGFYTNENFLVKTIIDQAHLSFISQSFETTYRRAPTIG